MLDISRYLYFTKYKSLEEFAILFVHIGDLSCKFFL